MTETLIHRTRRQKYLINIVLLACLAIFLLINGLEYAIKNGYANWIIFVFQCAIPLACIFLAGIFVSLPGKIIRSKLVLVLMFIIILCLGIIVNTESSIYEKDYNLFRIILHPFNTTLASFFPSRGDYTLKPENIELYLIFHSLTYFYAAWLGFSLFGRKLLNRTALCFMPRRHKNLIWGHSDGAFELAKDMIVKTERDEPIFILDDDIEFESEKEKMIFDKLSNESILAVNTHYNNLSDNPEDFNCSWLSRHYWRVKLTTGRYFDAYRHYFITENQDFNVKYALKILNQLSFRKDKLTQKTHLFVRTEQEGIDAFFQEKRAGLEDLVEIHIFNQSDITARQFVISHPVLDLTERYNPSTGEKWLNIEKNSLRVNGDINILLLGLGWTGFELLKKIVSNAQFIGDYRVNIVVIDNDFKQNHGRFQFIVKEAARFGVNICINPFVWINQQHAICKQWLKSDKCAKDTSLEEKRIHHANGDLFYEWLNFKDAEGVANVLTFNRIIVALGSDELNINTALQLTKFRNHYLGIRENLDAKYMPEPIFAHVRDRESYDYYAKSDVARIQIFGGLRSIYNTSNLVDEKIDTIAKLVNHAYSKYDVETLDEQCLLKTLEDGEADSEWASCSIFDQDSSRAVAMNIDNMVRLAGGSIEQLENMIHNPLYIDRLSELEHKRWNAFHYMRGIGVWPKEEVQPSIDLKNRTKINGKLFLSGALVRHICLVDYEELDAATRRINILGNTAEDYKATDHRIIRHFPTFYRILNKSNVN